MTTRVQDLGLSRGYESNRTWMSCACMCVFVCDAQRDRDSGRETLTLRISSGSPGAAGLDSAGQDRGLCMEGRMMLQTFIQIYPAGLKC